MKLDQLLSLNMHKTDIYLFKNHLNIHLYISFHNSIKIQTNFFLNI